MKISKAETPRLWNDLVLNESKFNKLLDSTKEFNRKMFEKYAIRFGLVVLNDVIIIDDKCIDEFDELIEGFGK